MQDDLPQPVISMNNTWKTVITIAVLLFHGAIVVYLIFYGKSDNSLHTSAMAWSFATGAAILAGLGFGAIAPLIATALKK